jgi:hypothetical protein
MSLFTAYFDDSGTHAQASVAVAACFISTLDKWNVLGKLWSEVNKKEQFGIFHMADFVAKLGPNSLRIGRIPNGIGSFGSLSESSK